MALFGIGDLHLSLGGDKSMEIFPGWERYTARLQENWLRLVKPGDTVVLDGDTSWAMRLADTGPDFSWLQRLPGEKYLVKGNHDYWWTTARKMEGHLAQNGFSSLHILQNSAFFAEGCIITGTRAWAADGSEALDEKILRREEGRLRLGLEAAVRLREEERPGAEILVFLHYPPLGVSWRSAGILDILHEFGIRRCFYGHLHGASLRGAVQGEHEGIRFKLISADGLQFCPYKIDTPSLEKRAEFGI